MVGGYGADGTERLQGLFVLLAANGLHDLFEGHAGGRQLIVGVLIDCGHKGATVSRSRRLVAVSSFKFKV